MDGNRRYHPDDAWEQLGVDNMQMVNRRHQEFQRRYHYDEEELKDEYIQNRAKNREKRKVIKKDKGIKIKIPVKEKVAMATAVVLIAGVGKVHMDASRSIANQVAISVGLTGGVGVTDTSTGYSVHYADEWGNYQNLSIDYFVSVFSEKAQSKGISADEFAIFCDNFDICDASKIEGSSLLGRVGYELIAASQIYHAEDEVESKSGRSI